MAADPIDVLVEFTRVGSTANGPDEVLPLLADSARAHLPVEGAAVLRIAEDHLELVAASGLPAHLVGWTSEIDVIGRELGVRLLEAAGDGFAHAQVVPLVSGGDLFGVLVLLSAQQVALDPPQQQLAEALADVAAATAARAASYAELARSYAELRESREALARTESLRLIGQMTAGVSHDLKNILNPLALQLELLRRRCERGEKDAALSTIALMREVIGHGVGVVERLRAFSRQDGETELEEVDLARVIATAVELSTPRTIERGVAMRHQATATAPVRARAAELTTALVNLIVNATEAMSEGGTVTITSGDGDQGGWVEVADDGPGMPPEVQAHVFEPFFTTKATGTGLGLAMVYRFVESCRGKITLDTAPGRGTRIKMWFPAWT